MCVESVEVSKYSFVMSDIGIATMEGEDVGAVFEYSTNSDSNIKRYGSKGGVGTTTFVNERRTQTSAR